MLQVRDDDKMRTNASEGQKKRRERSSLLLPVTDMADEQLKTFYLEELSHLCAATDKNVRQFLSDSHRDVPPRKPALPIEDIELVRYLLQKGFSPSHVAILLPTVHSVSDIVEAMERAGEPINLQGKRSIYHVATSFKASSLTEEQLSFLVRHVAPERLAKVLFRVSSREKLYVWYVFLRDFRDGRCALGSGPEFMTKTTCQRLDQLYMAKDELFEALFPARTQPGTRAAAQETLVARSAAGKKIPLCQAPGCAAKYPCWYRPGVDPKSGIFCTTCAPAGCRDKRKKSCAEEGCDNDADYGDLSEGGGQMTHCHLHRRDGMTSRSAKYEKRLCTEGTCSAEARYGFPGGAAVRCGEHREEAKADVRAKLCRHEGCLTQPTFGYDGVATHCGTHRDPRMPNVRAPRCHGCQALHPQYAQDGAEGGQFCKQCALPDMVNVVEKRICACGTRATFGNVQDAKSGKPTCCVNCKSDDMEDVTNRRCAHAACRIINPAFNEEHSLRGKFCSVHKEAGMVDVHRVLCQEAGCPTTASYGCVHDRKFVSCGYHATKDMILLRSSRACAEEGCGVLFACFGYSPLDKSFYCKTHARDGMMDVKNQRCDHQDCHTLVPRYGHKGNRYGQRYCDSHAAEDMVDLYTKTCAFCAATALYGYPGRSPQFCTDHKMVNTLLRPRRKCSHCRSPATHGHYTAERCEACALREDRDFVEKKCTTCDLLWPLYEGGKCAYCIGNSHIRKKKESQLVKHLKDAFPEAPPTLCDKVPADLKACGDRYRPDVLWDMGHYAIIVECDEGQHRSYPEECECIRMINITQALSVPTFWLRFSTRTATRPRWLPKFHCPSAMRWCSVGCGSC